MMSKKDRVYTVLKGQKADRVPTGFWMHFPAEDSFGDAAVQAHLAFFEQTKTDVCKVMTEHLYPCLNNIQSAADWQGLTEYGEDAPFIRGQAEIVRSVVKGCPDAPVLATVHGVVASASHALLGVPKYDSVGRFAQLYHLRTNPEAIASAYRKIANTLCGMVRAVLRAGADGIYYAALGGEKDGFTDEEHRAFIAPLDRMVLEEAYNAGAKFVALHMCKPKVDVRRFRDYPCDVVNWGVEESGVTLDEGRRIFPDKVILGGFDSHHGALMNGTFEQIQRETTRIIENAGERKLILGSDCTLPGGLAYERIAMVAQACENQSAGYAEYRCKNG